MVFSVFIKVTEIRPNFHTVFFGNTLFNVIGDGNSIDFIFRQNTFLRDVLATLVSQLAHDKER